MKLIETASIHLNYLLILSKKSEAIASGRIHETSPLEWSSGHTAIYDIMPIVRRKWECDSAKSTAPMTVRTMNCGQTTSSPEPR